VSDRDPAELDSALTRSALAGLVPYEPGKPIEEVQRELGLDRVVKLASNEGSFGPFPKALEALARSAPELNRYPDGGAYMLRSVLAERHRVPFEEVAIGAGADGLIDCISQATLDPGDEIVCGWPSFPSYVIYALKLGATVRRIPLVEDCYDLEAMVEAIGPRTKLVYVCHPNNPTGTMNTRSELDSYFRGVPEHVVTVLDQAYFEYVEHPEYPDGIEEYFKAGQRVVVLRTFSKIYGLAGLRVGYALVPASLGTAIGKVRRAFDVSSQAQAAALASLDGGGELELARRRSVNAEGRAALEAILGDHGLQPAGPAVANFVYTEVGPEAETLFESLLREGVIVRPLQAFGAPEAIRVTVGAPEEQRLLRSALDGVLARVPS